VVNFLGVLGAVCDTLGKLCARLSVREQSQTYGAPEALLFVGRTVCLCWFGLAIGNQANERELFFVDAKAPSFRG
jgi:hypothetical protein